MSSQAEDNNNDKSKPNDESFLPSNDAASAMMRGVTKAVGDGWAAYTDEMTKSSRRGDWRTMGSPNTFANGVVRGYATFFQSMADASQDALKILGTNGKSGNKDS